MTGLSCLRSYDKVQECIPLLFAEVLIRECEAYQQRDHENVNNLHKLAASDQCRTGCHFHSLTVYLRMQLISSIKFFLARGKILQAI
jgi:hypothetical protein